MTLVGHTMGTPEYRLPEALELFARLGLEGAEVVWQSGYASGIDPGASREDLRALGSAAGHAGVPIVALTPYEDRFNSLDGEDRRRALDAYTRALWASDVLGSRWIRLYGGRFLPGEGDRPAKWEALVDSLRILGERAERYGVTICVETHFNTMTDTARNAADLVRQVGHPSVRVLYDQANLGFIGAEEWREALRELAGTIAYVHVKDFEFTGAHRAFAARDVSHVEEESRIVRSRVVGDGILPWEDILRALRAAGYDGPLSLEYERRWHPQDLPPAAEGMAKAAERIRAWLAR